MNSSTGEALTWSITKVAVSFDRCRVTKRACCSSFGAGESE